MGKRMTISAEQVAEMEAARAKNKNKSVEKRLRALLLYAEGAKRRNISCVTATPPSYPKKPTTLRNQNSRAGPPLAKNPAATACSSARLSAAIAAVFTGRQVYRETNFLIDSDKRLFAKNEAGGVMPSASP